MQHEQKNPNRDGPNIPVVRSAKFQINIRDEHKQAADDQQYKMKINILFLTQSLAGIFV